MKSIRLKIFTIMYGVSLLSMLFMQFFTEFFLNRNTEEKGSTFFLVFIVLTILVGIASVILYVLLKPFTESIKKIETGKAIDEIEKKQARRIISKVPSIIILLNIVGFFFGPIVSYIAMALAAGKTFNIQEIISVLFLNVSIGFMSALQQILLIDRTLMKSKEKLAIYTFTKESKEMSMQLRLNIVNGASIFFTAVLTILAALGRYKELILQNNADSSNGISSLAFVLEVGFIGVFALVWSQILISTLAKNTSSQIKYLEKRIQEISEGGGDLTARAAIVQFDEMGSLSSSFNGFLDSLQILLLKVKDLSTSVKMSSTSLGQSAENAEQSVETLQVSVEKVHEASGNQSESVTLADGEIAGLTDSIEHIVEEVSTQAGFVEQSSASVAEMAANISSVTRLTEKADILSTKLKQTSKLGGDAVTDTTNAMKGIAEASKSVNEIILVIQKITAQTNLLAMNAAIEAAHAGSAGEGFAVVANEVRNLAESSAKSAKAIVGLVKDMINKVNDGVLLSGKANEAFNRISEGIVESADVMKTIAASMEEQKIGADEILSSSQSLVDATQRIKTLTVDQRERSVKMKEAIGRIVKSSDSIEEAIQDESGGIQSLSRVISIVHNEAQKNASAVKGLDETVNRFTLE